MYFLPLGLFVKAGARSFWHTTGTSPATTRTYVVAAAFGNIRRSPREHLRRRGDGRARVLARVPPPDRDEAVIPTLLELEQEWPAGWRPRSTRSSTCSSRAEPLRTAKPRHWKPPAGPREAEPDVDPGRAVRPNRREPAPAAELAKFAAGVERRGARAPSSGTIPPRSARSSSTSRSTATPVDRRGGRGGPPPARRRRGAERLRDRRGRPERRPARGRWPHPYAWPDQLAEPSNAVQAGEEDGVESSRAHARSAASASGSPSRPARAGRRPPSTPGWTAPQS